MIELFCPLCRCSKAVLRAEPITGFVYILSNDLMPGIVKIGYTQRNVSERIVELSAPTGVGLPFKEEASFPVTDPSRAERLVHEGLSEHRVSKDREFFRLDLDRAVRLVRELLGLPNPSTPKQDTPDAQTERRALVRRLESSEIDSLSKQTRVLADVRALLSCGARNSARALLEEFLRQIPGHGLGRSLYEEEFGTFTTKTSNMNHPLRSKVESELSAGYYDEGIWLRMLAKNKNDEYKAQEDYISIRMEQLARSPKR